MRGLVAAVITFATFGLGWFAAVAWRLGLGPLEYFFLRENLERFAGDTYDAYRSPLYYVWTYFAAGLPWSLLFPLAAWRGGRRARFLLLWMGLMAVPLSLSRGKIDYYLLPLLPAASLVIGSHLAAEWDRVDRAWARAASIAFALLALVPAALQPRIPTDWLPGWPAQVALIALGAAVALAAALAAPRSPSRVARRVRGRHRGHSRPAGRRVPARLRAPSPATPPSSPTCGASVAPDAELAACGDPRVARDSSSRRGSSPGPLRRRAPRPRACRSCSWSAPRRKSLESVPGIREVAVYPACRAATGLGQIQAAWSPEPVVLLANYPPTTRWRDQARQDRKRALRREVAAWEAAQRQAAASGSPAPPVRP